MPVQTYVDQAQTRVRAELAAVDAKLDGIDAFIDRVDGLSTESARPSTDLPAVAGGGAVRTESASGNRCQAVRTAFAETIRPHSVADVDDPEPLLETMREEFTDTIAVALAPTTETGFTPGLKRMVLAEARSRRSEATALRRALDREDAHLDDAGAAVDDVVDWIVDANETPLTDLGFDALKRYHETFADRRARCEAVARDRQAFLRRTTSDGLDAGVPHRSLVPYLYQDFPVDHPVLATAAALDETCRDCQRVVRDHLVRRA